MKLELYEKYSIRDMCAIIDPSYLSTFDSIRGEQEGKWGGRGVVTLTPSSNYVFLITLNKPQYQDKLYDNGVLFWHSQESKQLHHNQSQNYIQHIDRGITIIAFIRATEGQDYSYLGELSYLEHDLTKEKPLHIHWMIKDWNIKGARASLENHKISLNKFAKNNFFKIPGTKVKSKTKKKPKGRIINHGERDRRNRELGLAGEEFVLQYEKQRLEKLGLHELSKQIIHSSIVIGDGLGYDIQSFCENKDQLFIEVKTTEGELESDFFMSQNERNFSRENKKYYAVYRVYEFDREQRTGKLEIYLGDINKSFEFVSDVFRVKFKD